MDVFINKAISNGINCYLLKSSNKSYYVGYYYELVIVEILISIYGEFNIVNPYKIKYDKLFINNLKVYGLTSEDLGMFFDALDDYDKWLGSSNGVKSSCVNIINNILVKMILLKNLHSRISYDEIMFYDNYLGCKDIRFTRVMSTVCDDYLDSVRFWNRKKNIYLSNRVFILSRIEADFLSNTMYERHGININQIRMLSNLKVNEINNIIKDDESNVSRKSPFRLVLTSGSGIIDTIVLFSIVLTEIFIGFLIALFGRQL